MRKRKLNVARAVAFGALLSVGALHETQAAAPASQTVKGVLSQQDQDFIEKAARAGLAEVQLSVTVESRASSAELKDFVNRMMTDHGKSNAELTNLAKAKGVLPPNDMDDAHRDLRQKLGQLKGNELERQYVDVMLKDHEQAVALFEGHVARGQDPDLKKFAQETLPTLRHHLAMVKSLDQKLKKTPTAQRP